MENRQTLRQVIDECSNVARFAKCLGVSRPSMYKYIDLYDKGDTSSIPENVLAVFKTLMSGNRNFRMNYCNDLYAKYLNDNEQTEEPVPDDIAKKIDDMNITLDWVDSWITITEQEIERNEEEIRDQGWNRDYIERNRDFYEGHIRMVKKRLEDLEYTRELIEKRNNEKHFLSPDMKKMESIEVLDWTVSTGKSRYDLWPTLDDMTEMWRSGFIDLTNTEINSDVKSIVDNELEQHPELKDAFKYSEIKTEEGYVFFFAGASEDDEIVVNIYTDGFNCQGVYTRIASFSPDKKQFFVKIPKIFDDKHESCFGYEVERRNNGVLLNRIRGSFGFPLF